MKTTTSVGPYLHKDGTFRNLVYIQKLAVGTAIYGATVRTYHVNEYQDDENCIYFFILSSLGKHLYP